MLPVLVLQVNLTKIWYTFSSLLLSMTFIFGNSIKNTYESVIFLFVVHPFDVGDGVYIGTGQTDFYTVTCSVLWILSNISIITPVICRLWTVGCEAQSQLHNVFEYRSIAQ